MLIIYHFFGITLYKAWKHAHDMKVKWFLPCHYQWDLTIVFSAATLTVQILLFDFLESYGSFKMRLHRPQMDYTFQTLHIILKLYICLLWSLAGNIRVKWQSIMWQISILLISCNHLKLLYLYFTAILKSILSSSDFHLLSIFCHHLGYSFSTF